MKKLNITVDELAYLLTYGILPHVPNTKSEPLSTRFMGTYIEAFKVAREILKTVNKN